MSPADGGHRKRHPGIRRGSYRQTRERAPRPIHAPPNGGKRRVVGVDDWGWEHVARWTEHGVQLPIGPLSASSRHQPRARMVRDRSPGGELRRLAAQVGVRRRFACANFGTRTRSRWRTKGSPLPISQRQPGHYAGEHVERGHQRDEVEGAV
jgi:hypothetical protein